MKGKWIKSTTAVLALAGSALAMQQAQAGCGVPDQALRNRPRTERMRAVDS